MVKDTTGMKASATQVAINNPFSVLGNKKSTSKQVSQGDKREKHQSKAEKKDEKGQSSPTLAPAIVEPSKPLNKKEAKILFITAEPPKKEEGKTDKDIKKEEKLEAKAEKIERTLNDRRDRSGKGTRVRKEGKGTGGWEEFEPEPEVPAEEGAVASPAGEKAGEKAEETPKTPEQIEQEKKAEEEAKAREEEEKQMTYDEYIKRQSASKLDMKLDIRTVDEGNFANMKAVRPKVGDFITFKVNLKDATNKKPEPEKKVEKKADEKKREEKKINLQETGFRMDNPVRAERRGGRGMREGGERRGRGRGRGYGGGQYPKAGAPLQIDSEVLFPSLPTASKPEGEN